MSTTFLQVFAFRQFAQVSADPVVHFDQFLFTRARYIIIAMDALVN
nr:MAG TPA: hypothetical protein [Caudoviricetes sp.]DAV01798.1 MAG TPA: hypothetical protein [Caudoviricetes sp.]